MLEYRSVTHTQPYLQAAAIDIYIYDFSTIGYITQDLVAFIFLKNKDYICVS